jgi:hypothetical protein
LNHSPFLNDVCNSLPFNGKRQKSDAQTNYKSCFTAECHAG